MIEDGEHERSSFPLGEVREEGGQVGSFEVLLRSPVDFEVLFRKMKDVDSNLEFLRWANFDSKVDKNEVVGGGCEDKLEVT